MPAFLHLQCANRLFWPLLSKYTILVPYLLFRVFCRIQIKYRIIIIKLCMRKCEIVKKNQNSCICNDFQKLLCICNIEKKCDAYWIIYWTFCTRPLCDFDYCNILNSNKKKL